MFAHLIGIPVEETALSLAPLAAATGGIAGIRLRQRIIRRRSRRRPRARAPRRNG
jgi:hypothetical protein